MLGAFQNVVVFVVVSDNRIPDLLTVMLILIPRLVLPDPTPFFAFDL